ncbi:MAG: hypothetical protein J5563_06860, partial [Clostridia bacterium]|nr:hypothetical protein [Clostridia bacterium]
FVFNRGDFLKKSFIVILVITVLFSMFALSVSAENGRAPGGVTVTNQQGLFEALGGEQNCLLNSDGVLLCFDTVLERSIMLDGGEYTLTGAGAKLISGNTGYMFYLINGASLTIGSPTGSGDEGIIFEGSEQSGLLSIGYDCSAIVLFGVSASGFGFSHAICNDGTFALYAGTFEKCGNMDDMGGGFLLNYGTALLAGGTVKNCFSKVGGAVCNASGTLSLAGTEIYGCHADIGGAVWNSGEGTVEIVSSYISDCYATDGGAVNNGGTFVFSGGQISGSVAHGDGGAINNQGKIILNGTYIDGSSADGKGGTVFNYPSGVITMNDGTLSGGTAKKGGNVYNEGEFVLSGGSLSKGEAEMGGGIFNSGTLEIQGGGFSACKAGFGKAVFNTGRLLFIEYPYIDKKYDVFVDLNKPDSIPEVASEMKAETICLITPGRYSGDTAVAEYVSGTILLQGEYAEQCSGRFGVMPDDGREWKIVDGRLTAVKTMWERPWIYIGTAVLWIAFIAIAALLGIRFTGKKHEEGK